MALIVTVRSELVRENTGEKQYDNNDGTESAQGFLSHQSDKEVGEPGAALYTSLSACFREVFRAKLSYLTHPWPSSYEY